MKEKTFNPFKLFGSYLGLLFGVYAVYKEINPFFFLNSFFDFLGDSKIKLNIIGGFFVGYALHLFIRSVIVNSKNKTMNFLNKKKNLYGKK